MSVSNEAVSPDIRRQHERIIGTQPQTKRLYGKSWSNCALKSDPRYNSSTIRPLLAIIWSETIGITIELILLAMNSRCFYKRIIWTNSDREK
jgi:hypothetical protein